MNKNLEDFIRKDIDILLEDGNLTSTLSDMLLNFIENDDIAWKNQAYYFLEDAAAKAKKIVKENEEAGL